MKILIASRIDSAALEQLRQRHDVRLALDVPDAQLKAEIADRECIVFRSGVEVTADVIQSAPDLKLLVRAGSGLDNVNVDRVRDRGLTLVTIPQPGARAVAELTFALMLSLARQVILADRLLRRGRWAKHELTGRLLQGRTLGIVGAGSIGTCVGELAAAWGMRVLGCVEHPSATVATSLRRSGIQLTDLDDVLTQADFVTLHVPLNDSTRMLIDDKALQRFKRGAFLINTARGGVVDEIALYQALVTNEGLAGAALDVHEQEGDGVISPLSRLSNVIVTPHIGAMTADTQGEIGKRIVACIDEFSSSYTPALPVHESGVARERQL